MKSAIFVIEAPFFCVGGLIVAELSRAFMFIALSFPDGCQSLAEQETPILLELWKKYNKMEKKGYAANDIIEGIKNRYDELVDSRIRLFEEPYPGEGID